MNIKKYYFTITSVIVILVVFFAYNYLTTSTETLSQLKPDAMSEPVKNNGSEDICQIINNSTFISTKKYNVGMGPGGPVSDNFEIKFSNGGFEWSAAEVGGGNGTYICSNNKIVGKIGETYTISATYNNETKILLWDKIEYKK